MFCISDKVFQTMSYLHIDAPPPRNSDWRQNPKTKEVWRVKRTPGDKSVRPDMAQGDCSAAESGVVNTGEGTDVIMESIVEDFTAHSDDDGEDGLIVERQKHQTRNMTSQPQLPSQPHIPSQPQLPSQPHIPSQPQLPTNVSDIRGTIFLVFNCLVLHNETRCTVYPALEIVLYYYKYKIMYSYNW